ncbi:MAG: ABC transporter substrate-binding protein [Chloroflexi bacterium]|nr:ABC transporter substrate-binding protein [Chloroflexota bacterium]
MRSKFLPVLLIMTMLFLSACAPTSPTPIPETAPAAEAPATPTAAPTESPSLPITVTDALDRTVVFEQPPQKIVLIGKALFMVADAIYLFPEAGNKIAALSPTNQGVYNFIPMIDPTFNAKISLETNAGAEQIAAVQPDLVIMKSMMAETLGAPLEALNIPVLYLDFETADQYKHDLATLGQLFQNPAQAEKIAAFYQEKVDSITQTLSGLTEDQKPSVLLLYYSEKEGTLSFNVPPKAWMQTWMIQTAGGNPVWLDANPGKGWAQVNLEQIAAWNPDTIFIASYIVPVNDVVAKLKADPQWQLLNAVKQDKLYGFATDVYSWDQPDTRWALGLTWVAATLHPELFPGLDITAEAKAFYQELYGMDSAAFEKNIQPILTGSIK